MSATLVLEVVSTVAAAVAASAGVISVVLARRTVSASRQTITEAERARAEAERDRKRHRIERVGELVEKILWQGVEQLRGERVPDWRETRNLLVAALIGLEGEMPMCLKITELGDAGSTGPYAEGARKEISEALKALGGP